MSRTIAARSRHLTGTDHVSTPAVGGSAEGASATPAGRPRRPHRKPRLLAVDAARGLALIGMFSIHIMNAYDARTFEPTLQWTLFAGRAAALFVLLAGLGLALFSGGRIPQRGRQLSAARAGLAVRALLIMAVGLLINELMPTPPHALDILVHYGVLFLLAIPFLGMRRRTLAVCAVAFAVLGPVLRHVLAPGLPLPLATNLTFGDIVGQPGAALSQLLLTGSYPAVPYMAYLCAGLFIGRCHLRQRIVAARMAVLGVGLALGTWLVYWGAVLQSAGYDALLEHTPWLSEEQIDEIIVWGSQAGEAGGTVTALPTSTWWWLLIPGPRTNTPVMLLMNLGVAVAVLGVVLLVARKNWFWTTLAAMGGCALTLYSAHLLALIAFGSWEPLFLVHVGVAAAFAVLWRKRFGQGPLEGLVAAAVRVTRRAVLVALPFPDRPATTGASSSGARPPGGAPS